VRSIREQLFSLPVVVALVTALVAGFTVVSYDDAFAKEYPSWDDVLEARENEEKTKEKIEELQGYIDDLAREYQAAEEEAARIGQEFVDAQQALTTRSTPKPNCKQRQIAPQSKQKNPGCKQASLWQNLPAWGVGISRRHCL
jgi:hypothetical protein